MNRNKLLTSMILILKMRKKSIIILKILDANLQPIKKTKVNILGSNINFSLTTDSYGFIKIRNLPLGKYKIEVPLKKSLLLNKTIDLYYYGIYEVIVKKDFYNEISGTVYTKEDNKPLPNIIIILFKFMKKYNKYIPIKKTVTNCNGEFVFRYIPCGYYFIRAIK